MRGIEPDVGALDYLPVLWETTKVL